ncbi:MAG: TraM recognition domain-containing protein [Acidimicrobiia bacterium]|nr:TraM recognition domain-containing protein [Acidimicrobiia bacterium]
MLLALDEAMNIAPLRDLAVLASTVAGTGIELITIAHDFSQIVARYGEAEAHTIVANHSLLLLGGGLREHALGVLLDRLVDPHQIPNAAGWGGSPSEWVRRLDASQALLIHRDLPPEVIDVTRWFDDDAQVLEHLIALYDLEERPEVRGADIVEGLEISPAETTSRAPVELHLDRSGRVTVNSEPGIADRWLQCWGRPGFGLRFSRCAFTLSATTAPSTIETRMMSQRFTVA